MRRQHSIRIGQIVRRLLAVLLIFRETAVLAAEEPARPNLVLIIADDISWNDLGCYGHPVIHTPNVDRMAARGLRFTNAYLTTSSCSPSRCSLISGRYPHNTGAPELHTPLPEGQVLFPELLRESGYHTVLSGKHHMGKYASTAFDRISGGRGPGKEADWVDVLRDRPRDRPFFAWLASTDAHRGWNLDGPGRRYTPQDVVVPAYLVNGPKTREDLTGYYHEVSRLDHYVGEVVDELDRQDLAERTVVIFMADNGRPFPRDKTRLYDEGIKTPLVLFWPGRVKPAVTSSLVSAIDIGPTLLELAGVSMDPRIQGVSFAGLLDDPVAVVRDVAFAEHNWHVYRNHERMVRTGDWLYIRNNFPGQRNLCVEGLKFLAGEELWAAHAAGTLSPCQEQVVRSTCPPEELYRVSADPHQLHDLAEDPARAETLEWLRGLLAAWTEQTGDTVPGDPTPDRDARPGEKRKSGAGFRHREFPGAARRATEIRHPGPVRVDRSAR